MPRTRSGRAALIANITNLIGEWQSVRRHSGDSLAAPMRALLDAVDLNRVATRSLLAAFGTLLAGLPNDSLAEVSAAADDERSILTQCMGDRALGLADDQLTASMAPADRQLVSALSELRGNPAAIRAAADLVSALGRSGPKARQTIATITGGDALAGSEVR